MLDNYYLFVTIYLYSQYDKYVGVEKLLPYAKGISAKSHEFNSQGEEKSTDYSKMMDIISSSSYQGFITIEYEYQGDEEEYNPSWAESSRRVN